MRRLLLILALLLFASTAFAAPPTPTNAPRAHPLAPNPHTSIGLFWIYTDATTGRQSTAVTYKVLFCTGASCTPLTEAATGLTTTDYQHTGRASNTIHGYCVKATDGGGDSACSPTVYVTTLTADSNLVQFPDTTWSNMLGPLPESAQIPFAYFRDTMTAQGADVISKYPVVGPGVLLGTGSITNGTTALTGTGTFFLEQVAANNPTCLDNILINGVNAGAIASVNSNTSITLSTTWNGGTQTNVTLSTNDSVGGACGGNDPLSNWLTGNQLMYYDSMLALWQVYFMTGDPQYLRGAIQGSEAIFAGLMWLGRNRAWQGFSTTPDAPVIPPRNFQFSGYTLLGMAGHNGVWDLLDKYLTDFYAAWISNYRGGNNNFTYPREKAYMIRFVNDFIIAAPDSFPRSNGTTTSLNGGTTVDGDLTDGRKDFWRDQLNIDVPGLITDDHRAEGFWTDNGFSNATADGDYPYGSGEITGPAQPAFQGLMADALGFCWRNTALSSTARDAARRLVLRTVAAMGHLSYNTNLIPQDTSKRWRYDWYFSLGGTRLNPYAFQYGADRFVLNDTPYSNSAALSRQGLPLMLSSFGWAKAMAGSNNSWYESMALEMANAAFAAVGENTGGTGDGLKTLCDSDANYKDYGQCFRMAPRFFGEWLSAAGTLATAPTVTMPTNMTLTGGVNQAVIPAPTVNCPNGGCTYRWSLQEYPMINNPRYEPMPVFTDVYTLATKLCGLEPGVYKLIFYTLDTLGLEGHGTMNVTVGDGVFPPVATIGYGNPSAEEQHQYFTTSSSLSGSSRCYSIAGRTVTHSYAMTSPKDKSATLTPASTTSNVSTFSITGLSAGLWIVTDTCTDSASASRKTIMYIRHTAEAQPSAAHNTIPTVGVPPHHVLPVGSTNTRLFVVPRDPEGIANYTNPATGYTQGETGAADYLVTALTHSWTQTAGPVSATITNGTTIRPDITGMTVSGTYTFRYIGTDQQGDPTALVDINVTVSSTSIRCTWAASDRCQ